MKSKKKIITEKKLWRNEWSLDALNIRGTGLYCHIYTKYERKPASELRAMYEMKPSFQLSWYNEGGN
jgi:hypothetical protein